jgi:serine protease Do
MLWGLLLAGGLVFWLALSGTVSPAGGSVLAAERGTGNSQPPAATTPAEKLKELQGFASRFEELFQAVAAEVSPAVVLIEAEKTVRETAPGYSSPFDDFLRNLPPDVQPFFQPPQQPGNPQYRQYHGLGSGSIIDDKGHVLTNYHVVEGADQLRVKVADGRVFDAKIAGTDQKTELAVITLQGDVKDLPVGKLGNSDGLKVGQWVLAIGNPFGLSHTVSAGIISATGRTGIGIADYESMIQTDAAINPGNSGGPLVNLQGEVIGINTAILSRTGGSIGIGFAIPVKMAKEILPELIAGQPVIRGYLGVYIGDVVPDIAKQFKYSGTGGALVNEITPDSSAAKAGLQAGDIITEYEGQPVANANDLRSRVAGTKPDTEAKLKVWREGKEETLTVKLGNLETAVAAVPDWLGIQVQPLTKEMAEQMGRANLQGVLVAEVASGSNAEGYIRPGDVILSVNRQKVTSVSEFMEKIKQISPGAGVMLQVLDSSTGRMRFVLLRGRSQR